MSDDKSYNQPGEIQNLDLGLPDFKPYLVEDKKIGLPDFKSYLVEDKKIALPDFKPYLLQDTEAVFYDIVASTEYKIPLDTAIKFAAFVGVLNIDEIMKSYDSDMQFKTMNQDILDKVNIELVPKPVVLYVPNPALYEINERLQQEIQRCVDALEFDPAAMQLPIVEENIPGPNDDVSVAGSDV